MILPKLAPVPGEPMYLHLMQRIRHAAEIGALQDGDQLPSIRALAEELVVSPNTVSKAYSELEHEGLIELRQGSGAFVKLSRRARSFMDHVERARDRVGRMISFSALRCSSRWWRLRRRRRVDQYVGVALFIEKLTPALVSAR